MSGLYEKILANLGSGESLPASRPPRASASIVPWRRREDGIEVYWVRRSRTMPFMGGWHAFPGGGLDRNDVGVEVGGSPEGAETDAADGAMPPALLDGVDLGPLLPDGLVACALRELFEEAGLALLSEPVSEEALRCAREALNDKSASFADVLADLGATPDASRLVYAGRWLTPPMGPLRFDNRFFLLEWTEDLGEMEILPGELDHGEWIRPDRALDQWRSGEATLAPPIVHILRVLDAEGPIEGLDRMRRPLEANLGEHRRIEFLPGVLLFPQPTHTLPPASHTNAFLIGRGSAILLDPGAPDPLEAERLAGAIRALESQEGTRLEAICLTHHHPDHIGGVAALQRTLQVPVRGHPETVRRLSDADFTFGDPLEEGDRIVLGRGPDELVLDVLHTPGHARGHLCFHEARRRWIFGGDMVAGFGTIVIDPPEGNMEQYLSSLRRLEALDARVLFPGHGPLMIEPSRKFGEYVRHRLWREEKILAAWSAGVRTPEEMLATVYEDVPAIAHPLAVRQIKAHLERLETLGKLD